MEYQSLIITHLHRVWEEQVASGHITQDELYDSLLDQVTGSMDMSADELDDTMCRLMGWNPSAITESQYKEWRHLVDLAATEYMYQ